MHHDIEEKHMFPGLAAQPNDALRHVVIKLKSEHEVIHELLDRLRRAATDLSKAPEPQNFEAAHAVFKALRAAVQSHFGYEETELEEAIGLFLGGL